jgi:plasmid stability protein
MSDTDTKIGQSRQPRTAFHTLLVFRCPTVLSEDLAEVAARRGTSVSAVIRDLLRNGLTLNRVPEHPTANADSVGVNSCGSSTTGWRIPARSPAR